jgi:hypothetical protein
MPEPLYRGERIFCACRTPMSHMTPSEIVSELDKHIVGQDAAKRAVAIASAQSLAAQQVPEPLRQEITPKNILMIGPTGVGKTEIARRLARLAEAPFIKVEATKFTEVGYVGRDVDTIIRDLVEAALKQTREAETRKVRDRAADAAEERLLDVLLPPAREVNIRDMQPTDTATRQRFRKMLREGKLDDKEVEVEVSLLSPQMEIMAPPGMEDLTSQLQGMFQQLGGARRKLSKMPVAEALKALTDEEAAKLINDDDMKSKGARRGRAERHRVLRRDRQDREPAGDPRRRRLAPGRATRPPAARRGHDGFDQVRHGAHRSHPVHRVGRLPFLEAVRPHSGIAGALPDPGRAHRRSRSTTSSRFSRRRTPASSASTSRCSRRRTCIWISRRTASGGWPRSPSPSTSGRKTSARGASIR